MPITDRKLHVFLCHASQDKTVVRELYQRLLVEGWIDPWLDDQKLLPGQDWDFEIRQAVREADVVILFLSKNSVTKEGYVQREVKLALNIAEEKPENTIFLIPARLDECTVPKSLDRWQWVNLFEADGYDKVVHALRVRRKQFVVGETETHDFFPYFENILNDHGLKLGAHASFENRLKDPTSIYLPLRYDAFQANGNLDEYLKSEFVKPGILLLMGDYGSGKSFIVRRYLADQVQRWKEPAVDSLLPLPVFYSLNRFTNMHEGSIIDEILRELRAGGVITLQRTSLQRMIEDGKMLFILDGFDEILLLAHSANIQQRFQSIVSPLMPDRNRILITSRPGVVTWLSNTTEISLLEALRLLPWNKDVWDDYLYACKEIGWDFPLENIKVFRDLVLNHEELSTLTNVPLYCQMMVETSRQLIDRLDSINLVVLYDLYIQSYLMREVERSVIKDVSIKLELMMAVALGMLQKDRMQFTISDMEQALRENAQHLNAQIIDAFATHDLAVHSLLVFDHENRLSFSHKSFYEYFTALRIYQDFKNEVLNNKLTILKGYSLSMEIIGFLMKMFTDEDKTFLQMIPVILADNSNSLGVSRSKFLLRNLALIQLMITGKLFNLKLSELDFRGLSFSGGQSHLHIVNVNLDRCKLANADLQKAELTGSSLRGANLQNCILDNANLMNVDLSGANLRGISCSGTKFHGAKFDSVKIDRTTFHQILSAIYAGEDKFPTEFDDQWTRRAQDVLEKAMK
jgi:uncharacterized protein YjbI with pentapeptide repeats